MTLANSAPVPLTALPSVNQSATWKSRIIENALRGLSAPIVGELELGAQRAVGAEVVIQGGRRGIGGAAGRLCWPPSGDREHACAEHAASHRDTSAGREATRAAERSCITRVRRRPGL